MATAQAHVDHQHHRQWVLAQIDADPSGKLLTIIRAAVLKFRAGTEVKKLARGVRFVSATPDYLIKELLNEVTLCDLSVFNNIGLEDLRCMWVFALGVTMDYKVPTLQMQVSEYKAWCVERYRSMGNRLEAKSLLQPDWEMDLGYFGFHVPADQLDSEHCVD
eukprot:7842386-Lingulodinium_polyedra.AAC.1